MAERPYTPLTPVKAIRELRDRLAPLAIHDADPTEYDRGANRMLDRVLAEVDVYLGHVETIEAPIDITRRSATQQRVYELVQEYGQITESRLRALVYPGTPPDLRPRLQAALSSLERGHFVRRSGNRWMVAS